MWTWLAANYLSLIAFVVCGVVGVVALLFFLNGMFMVDDPYLGRFRSWGLTETEVLEIEEKNLIFGIQIAVVSLVVILLCAGGIYWGITKLEPEPSFLRKTARF